MLGLTSGISVRLSGQLRSWGKSRAYFGDKEKVATPKTPSLIASGSSLKSPGSDSSRKPREVKPGEILSLNVIERLWHTMPAVGLNAVLTLPVYKFENLDPVLPEASSVPQFSPPPVLKILTVPNAVFGVPLRKDIAHRAYWYYRRAMAGYQHEMQKHYWELEGSNRKVRLQGTKGQARMGRRTAPGTYDGSFATPVQPFDWRIKLPLKERYKALLVMLSAKYAQGEIVVVDSFNVQSHKTKNTVSHLRNLLGRFCKSALIVHEGNEDVNDCFRWACARLPQVRRENFDTINVWHLAKYHKVLFSQRGLDSLIDLLVDFPRRMKWLPRYATSDGRPASVPEKVPGWNSEWVARKKELSTSLNRAKLMAEEDKKWTWSTDLKGPLKIPVGGELPAPRIGDINRGFRVVENAGLYDYIRPWNKLAPSPSDATSGDIDGLSSDLELDDFLDRPESDE